MLLMNFLSWSMDLIHRYGVYFILWLQKVLTEDQSQRMVSITQLGDSQFLTMYIFPLISAVNGNLFIRVVLTTALVDMINNILKWVLRGERPYWWVHEAADNADLLALKQYPLTCETGPGSPSGHAMLTSSIWFIILSAYMRCVVLYSRRRKTLTIIIWTLYLTLFTVVSTSRLFIAAHFPHQVIAGGISGIIIGWYFTKIPILRFEPKHYMQILGAVCLFAVVVYAGLPIFGLDPAWSVYYARKWCQNPAWIHLASSPMSAMFRDCGAIVGLALARWWEPDLVSNNLVHKDGREIVTALISFVCVQICAFFPVFSPNILVYYLCVFAKYVLISFVAIAVVPKIVKISMNLKEFPITQETKIKEIVELTRRKRKMTAGF
uniref:glucose-6-phosphatase n=1 Tax=Romanomermis culicivorax TaxID=13658 RepID=A0A915JDP4_ROMCU